MFYQFLIFIFSFIVIYFGSEFVLSNSEKIGKSLGLSPLIIGMILIGFGTSLPEFFVSQLAALKKSNQMALGNIIGSNISNLLVVLAIASLIRPIAIKGRAIFLTINFHILLYICLLIVLLIGRLSILSSVIFVIFIIFYLFSSYVVRKVEGKSSFQENKQKIKVLSIFLLLFGFLLLYIGGELLVTSGKKICIYFGVSEYVISAIFIAFGTSFPEFMTSLLACIRRKNTDYIVGNVLGSNIFNVAFILGSLGIYNIKIGSYFIVEMAILFFASILLLIVPLLKKEFGRMHGVIFIIFYVSLLIYWPLSQSVQK